MTIQKLVLEDQVRYAEGVVADYLISQGWTEEDPAQEPLPVGDPVEVLTPRCTVEILRAGYVPMLHPSARPSSAGRERP